MWDDSRMIIISHAQEGAGEEIVGQSTVSCPGNDDVAPSEVFVSSFRIDFGGSMKTIVPQLCSKVSHPEICGCLTKQ